MNGDFRVGTWLVQPNLNSVSSNGAAVRLEPKVMEVLVCLASRPGGELLSKDAILKAVWPDTFVTEDVLTRSISELRRVFGDDARQPKFIQTIPKRGYRLVAPLEPADGNGGGTIAATRKPLQAKWLAAASALVVLLFFSLVVLNGWTNWRTKRSTLKSTSARVETRAENNPLQASLESGPTVLPNADAGTSPVPLPSPSTRREGRVQNIQPDAVWARVTHAVLPTYPAYALQTHVTGTVEIGLGVSPKGDVASARVLIGHPVLITPALEAIRQWRFQPNQVQGELTWSRMRALVRFRADGTSVVAFAPPLLPDSFGDLGTERDERRDAFIPLSSPKHIEDNN